MTEYIKNYCVECGCLLHSLTETVCGDCKERYTNEEDEDDE